MKSKTAHDPGEAETWRGFSELCTFTAISCSAALNNWPMNKFLCLFN